jgi:hypothetical protein
MAARSQAETVNTLPSLDALSENEVNAVVSEADVMNSALRSCLDPAKVAVNQTYTCADGSQRVGTLAITAAESHAFCIADGEVGCITTESHRAAEVSALPTKVLLGQSVAGIAGAVRLPTPGVVLDGEKFGVLDSTAGTLVVPSPSEVQAGTKFGITNSLTGTFAGILPNCTSDGQASCTVPASGSIKAAETAFLSAKVLSTASVAGVTGNVLLPSASQVSSGLSFGPSGSLTGSLTAARPNCTTDGETDCTVPASGSIKAADIAGFSDWDIRIKRTSDGSLRTFAGLSGKIKTCRDRVDLSIFNNVTAPATSDTLIPDFFDTIDDYNNANVGIPLDIPDWTIPGVAGKHGGDFACGGIYATGASTSGATGADASLGHDADGNWQDLTPGIVPGGAASNNPAAGCNHTDKFCVFRELISGLLVTEVSASQYTFSDAINYCDKLGKTGGVIPTPIPTVDVGIGTSHAAWRLPTQKEMQHLSNAGIRGLNQTANLVTTYGSVDGEFWSSTTTSFWTARSRHFELGFIMGDNQPKAYLRACQKINWTLRHVTVSI